VGGTVKFKKKDILSLLEHLGDEDEVFVFSNNKENVENFDRAKELIRELEELDGDERSSGFNYVAEQKDGSKILVMYDCDYVKGE
jgi:hypothetical protein